MTIADRMNRQQRRAAAKQGDAETNCALGDTLKQQGKLDEALACYRRAVAMKPNFAEAHKRLGDALYARGQHDEAGAHYRRAIASKPRYNEAHINLGLLLLEQGQPQEALAQARIAAGDSERAAFPHYPLGVLLARCGDTDGARISLEKYLQRDPEDREGARLLLAGFGVTSMPARASARQLDRLYDSERAAAWDQGAAGPSAYRGAELVAAALERFMGGAGGLDILDLGCGTGLVGMLVSKWARRLEGVDTSLPMLAQARQKNVYHQLHQQDLLAFLENNESSFDAVTCAATLIHFGDLRPVFEAIAARLRSGGMFICTLFPNDDDDSGIGVGTFDGMAEGGCYVHGRGYVASLAEATGFAVEAIERELHEYFRGKQRMGLIVSLRRNIQPA